MKKNALSAAILAAFAAHSLVSTVEAQISYSNATATGAWNTARWNNSADGPAYTTTYTANNPVQFTSGNYTFAGMGASTNVGNVTLSNNVTVSFPTIGNTFATGGNVRTIVVGAGSLFDLNGNAMSTAAGTGYIKNGAGVWALGGAAYTGGFTLNNGTVILQGTTAMGSGGALTINGGAIGANASRSMNNTRYTGGITIGGDFQLGVLSSVVSLGNSTADLSFDNNVNLGATDRKITIGANGTYTFGANAAISGGAGVALIVDRLAAASGVLVLSGTNTYSGGTKIQGGSLRVTSNNALGSGGVSIEGTGAEFRLITTAGINVSNNITISDTGDSKSIASFPTTGTLSGGITINETTAGNFVIQSGAGSTLAISGNITGAGGAGFKKTGSGNLTLSGTNTYAGDTVISAGVLLVGSSNAIASGAGKGNVSVDSSLTNAGTLDLNGNSITINGLSGGTNTFTGQIGNNLASTSATLTLGSGNATGLTYSGFIRDNTTGTGGTLSLIKTGTGTQTLAGNNTYSGNTTVSGGSLLVTNTTGSGTGSGAVTVSSGATLGGNGTVGGNVALDSATIGTAGNTLSLSSNLTTTGASNVAALSTVNVAGTTTVSTGSFTVNGSLGVNGSIAGSGTVTVASGGSLSGNATLNTATTLAAGGTLGTTGNTLILGSTLAVTGTNSIVSGAFVNVTENTTISAGIFSVNGTLGGAGGKFVTSGATLGGNGTILGVTTIGDSGTLAPGNSPGLLTFTGNLTFNHVDAKAIFEVNGSVRATDYDAVNVSGALAYNGDLTVNFGYSPTLPPSVDYDLFNFSGESGNFDSISIAGTYTASLSRTGDLWTGTNVANTVSFSFNQIDGVLTVAAIPEPSAYAALAGVGMIGVALYRRRRLRKTAVAA